MTSQNQTSWLRSLRRHLRNAALLRWRRKSFALNSLDLKLRQYLDYDHGFFVEAGANDGLTQSNTLYFERYQAWRGILIEPIPSLSKQCLVNRPKCQVSNCALVSFDYSLPTVPMRYCNLMSLVKGAMKSEDQDLKHVQLGCHEQQASTYELDVPARTLSAVLDAHQVTQVDLLSLDVEGFELNVLKGLDFDRWRPTFMLIEARFRVEIEAHLQSRYRVEAQLSEHDYLYRHND